MKRNILTYSAILAFLAIAATSCQKDSATATSFTATMEQCQEQDGKTVFSNGIMQWVSGDQIKVVGTGTGIYEAVTSGTGGTSFRLVSGDAGNAPYHAVYPASAFNEDGTVELPVIQVTTNGSLTGFPMYTESRGTALDFKNLCGILRLRLQKSGVSVTAIEITGDIELTGDFNVTYNGGTPTLAYSGHGTKTTMLTCSTPQSISRQKDFYIFLPDHTYTSMRIRIYNSDGEVCTKTLNANQSINIQRSKITTITMTNTNSLTFSPNAGALPGLFTIDDQGHQVRFSQGNMQYTTLGTHAVGTGGTEQGIWRFAPDQYDFVGEGNANASSTYPKWVDLFGWGTSGWNNGNIYYMPYSIGVSNGDVGYGYGPTDGSSYEYDLTSDNGNYVEADWAWHNPIQNGGNAAHQWRTLTQSEWFYLFNTRANASSKWGHGSINGVNGMIILPDNWTLPTSLTFTAGNSSWINNYTLVQWAEMEAAGAVFLPAAGIRNGTIVLNAGIRGIYWSSTRYLYFYAYYVRFYSGDLHTEYCYARANGDSVRPVQDVH